jgi:MOSC domain-containing protein YiiM
VQSQETNEVASSGRIVQVAVSPGGAPKLPVPSARVTAGGVDGDRQRMKNHGGPDRAVMLYSVEQIEALRRQGHPIAPGGVGENVTVEGIDLGSLGPGDRIRLGSSVVLEITMYPKPCDGIGAAFLGRDFLQVWHERHPGMSRLAARVLSEGEIAPGDQVTVLPRSAR